MKENLFGFSHYRFYKFIYAVIFLLILFGIFCRFYQINRNTFMHYDEGLYLNHNRPLHEIMIHHPPQNMSEGFRLFHAWMKSSLTMTKVLWVMVLDMRLLWGGWDDWYFARIVSALSGVFTVMLVYLFARRHYQSKEIAVLSALLLWLMPSDIFYSRMALQEAFCGFWFFSGLYLYIFPRTFNKRTFLSGLCFAAAFLTNYRLAIIPILIFALEFSFLISRQGKPQWRHYVWSMVVFLTTVILIGGLYGGRNSYIIFAWMIRQAQIAKLPFSFLNLFSYPYYLFTMENFFFGIFFFGNIYFLIRQKRKNLPLFGVSCLYMIFFTLAREKGARYLSVVYPLIVMSVSYVVFQLWGQRARKVKIIAALCLIFMLVGFAIKSFRISQFKAAYQESVTDILKEDPQAKILTTQPTIQNLFTSVENVASAPKNFAELAWRYEQGYRYLILDPQVYISWTKNDLHFTELKDYLDFILVHIRPHRIYHHFHSHLMERFVFEHNENLRLSNKFLAQQKPVKGLLRVYKIEEIINEINYRLKMSQQPPLFTEEAPG